MLIHIANKRTLVTKCNKTVKGRYWVSVSAQKAIRASLRRAHGANCKLCLEKS
jgi:hypothetical protein